MHAGFVSAKTMEAMMKSFSRLTEEHQELNLVKAEPEEVQIRSDKEAIQQMKEDKSASPPAKPSHTKQLSPNQIKFIRVQCIDAIKTKWQDRAQIKKELIAGPPDFKSKQDSPVDDKEAPQEP
jgi:hypothetical protein